MRLPCGTISWLSAAIMLFNIGASSLLLRTNQIICKVSIRPTLHGGLFGPSFSFFPFFPFLLFPLPLLFPFPFLPPFLYLFYSSSFLSPHISFLFSLASTLHFYLSLPFYFLSNLPFLVPSSISLPSRLNFSLPFLSFFPFLPFYFPLPSYPFNSSLSPIQPAIELNPYIPLPFLPSVPQFTFPSTPSFQDLHPPLCPFHPFLLSLPLPSTLPHLPFPFPIHLFFSLLTVSPFPPIRLFPSILLHLPFFPFYPFFTLLISSLVLPLFFSFYSPP